MSTIGVEVSACTAHRPGEEVLTPAGADDGAVRSGGGGAAGFTVAAYDDPDSMRFVEAVQAFYVERYGGVDRTPVDPAEFAPPRGLFLLGRLADGTVVSCGGWRRHEACTIDAADRDVLRPGDAEIKRMWVDPSYRRHGHARATLAEIERTAAAAGCLRAVLESGDRQPEAVALYASAGYTPIPGFGVYRREPGSCCFARRLVPGG